MKKIFLFLAFLTVTAPVEATPDLPEGYEYVVQIKKVEHFGASALCKLDFLKSTDGALIDLGQAYAFNGECPKEGDYYAIRNMDIMTAIVTTTTHFREGRITKSLLLKPHKVQDEGMWATLFSWLSLKPSLSDIEEFEVTVSEYTKLADEG